MTPSFKIHASLLIETIIRAADDSTVKKQQKLPITPSPVHSTRRSLGTKSMFYKNHPVF